MILQRPDGELLGFGQGCAKAAQLAQGDVEVARLSEALDGVDADALRAAQLTMAHISSGLRAAAADLTSREA